MNEGHGFSPWGTVSLVDVPKSVPQRLKPSSVTVLYGTAKPVPFVRSFSLTCEAVPFVRKFFRSM
jgi:hypothetical protein